MAVDLTGVLLSVAVATFSVALAYLATLLPPVHSKLRPGGAISIFVLVGLISVVLTAVKENRSPAEGEASGRSTASNSSPTEPSPGPASSTTTSEQPRTSIPPTTSSSTATVTTTPPPPIVSREKYLKEAKVSGDWNPH